MSANNQLIILKKKNKWQVHMHFCIDCDFKSSKQTLLKEFDDLESSIIWSNKYINEEMIEYGYHIIINSPKVKSKTKTNKSLRTPNCPKCSCNNVDLLSDGTTLCKNPNCLHVAGKDEGMIGKKEQRKKIKKKVRKGGSTRDIPIT